LRLPTPPQSISVLQGVAVRDRALHVPPVIHCRSSPESPARHLGHAEGRGPACGVLKDRESLEKS
jgi:hypothetical protein